MARTPFSPGLLPADNPISQWVAPRRNTLVGFGAGMLSPNFSDLGTSTMQGMALDRQYAMDAEEQAKEALQLNQTIEYMRSKGWNDLVMRAEAGDMQGAWTEATARARPQAAGENLMSVGGHLYDRASGQWISPPETAENRQNISLTPQWGQDAQGNPVMLQPSSTGELVQAQAPEGVTLLGPYGTSADRAAGSAFGKGTGSAQFDLPAAALTTQQTLAAIESVRNQSAGMEEQFGNIMGVPQQMLPTLPASERANFQVETNRLINRTFLEAREVLRGGGQITDFESRKAEGAISNLEEAMVRGDKALFQKSLDELEQAVRDGYAKLQAQAGAMPGYSGGQQQQAPGGQTSTGLQWSIVP